MSDRELFDERGQQAANEIRALLIGFIEQHEQDEHGGEVCAANRTGTLAFLAHSIGLRSGEVLTGPWLSEFVGVLREYEHSHANGDSP